ncbi:MAG: tRNA preQ1(34) S-adenosylmethionine ribosyltransferase-isomerase QueA [Chloroflexi bacterium]|nr:tRNA preQ1(34) S-adenosylmethionine ribosyltransferase-isomerase QueA [Chloroflexota bacterium]
MNVDDFDYDLPTELIAQEPLQERDAARLLVVNRERGTLRHELFRHLPCLLRRGDLLVANDSRVIPARLSGRKTTGGRVELLLIERQEGDSWLAMTRPRLAPGAQVHVLLGRSGEAATVRVVARCDDGLSVLQLDGQYSFEQVMTESGVLPLPSYIHRELSDPERYQTVYSREEGSVAAPTAGLHFTPQVLNELDDAGVERLFVTLHVGPGTFAPVRAQRIEDHTMHEERYSITEKTAMRINCAKQQGCRVVAVGTTTARALESAWSPSGLRSGPRSTRLFITPGFQFHVVDALITNFHLPRSTLLMLVSAFASHDLILEAYHVAVAERYRFFSLGDAMLIE